MAHYAFLDANNVVTEVITGRNEGEDNTDWEKFYGDFRGQKCVRTSYNGNIRGKYACIGDWYDEVNDVFVSPQMLEEEITPSNIENTDIKND